MKKGWSIEAERLRVAGVEVDLLARDPSGILHIIEVKSSGALVRGLVSPKQQKRLVRVAEIIAQREPVQMLALVVKSNRDILRVPLY